MDYSFVKERAAELRERVTAAAKRGGRSPGEVELLAVTKFHPLEAVEAAWRTGIASFGESRVQEAEGKFPAFLALHPEARLDMIGHLQSNKAKKAVELFSRVQSVDSEELLLELDKRARAVGRSLEVLLELHTGEASKEGFPDADSLYRALERLYTLPDRRLEPRGLMTMAPLVDLKGPGRAAGEAEARASFASLRRALEGARARFGEVARVGDDTKPPSEARRGFDILSMGMSGDYELAVEEGSTLVRIGTALFGERAP